MLYDYQDIPITEEELKDLTIVKAYLEQTLKRPLTIRAAFSAVLQYTKEKINTEEFKREISSMLEAKNRESSEEGKNKKLKRIRVEKTKKSPDSYP